MSKTIRIPGPDHPITVTHNPHRLVVTLNGKRIAETSNALTLQESHYPAVQYIPREDVDMTALERSEMTSYCPYKGDASYFSIPDGGVRSADAAWSYEAPYPSVVEIAGHLAFYPDRVDSIEEIAS